MARGLRDARYDFRVDAPSLSALLESRDELRAAAELAAPLLLLHAEGDEMVPVEHSRALHAVCAGSRLVAVPGGHHRSVQHDPELQAVALRFLRGCFGSRR
jgi:pimeloyl-ACP methyl ester carboxylesterase